MNASVESVPITPRVPHPRHGAPDAPAAQPDPAPHRGTSQVTQTVRAGIECGDATGCVAPPLHLSATFAFRGFAERRGYDYTRSGKPTRDPPRGSLAPLQ